MQIEFGEDVWGEMTVLLDGKYWLRKSPTYLFWWSDVVDPAEWFLNVYKPTPEELTLFELEFGKEVLDFVFSGNKELKTLAAEDFKRTNNSSWIRF